MGPRSRPTQTRRAPPGRVPGAARRRGGLGPSDLPRTPGGTRRPESTPTCCARMKPDFPGAQTDRQTALAIRSSGRPSSTPPRRAPALSSRTPNSSTRSCSESPLPPPLGCREHHGATPPPPKKLNSRCRPRCVVPPSRQVAWTPPPLARIRLHFGDSRLVAPGVPHNSAPVPAPPRYLFHSAAGQHWDSPAAATARQQAGRARAGRGRKAWSLEGGGSWRLGARPAQRRRPQAPPAGRRAIERPLWQA